MSGRTRIIINDVEYSADDAVVSAFDRGLQFGDGLFETMPVRDGNALLAEQHYERLKKGCLSLGIEMGSSFDAIGRAAARIQGGTATGVLKIIVTRGRSGRGYAFDGELSPTWMVSLSEYPNWPAAYAQQGVNVRVCKTPASRNCALAGIKHLNRLENVLARAELAADEQEGLLVDEFGHVIEGSMSNLFAVGDGVLVTPDLTHSGVCGIMRGVLLETAAGLSITTQVRQMPADELAHWDELFLCNSLIGVWPIKQIKHVEKYKKRTVTRKLQQAIREAKIFMVDV